MCVCVCVCVRVCVRGVTTVGKHAYSSLIFRHMEHFSANGKVKSRFLSQDATRTVSELKAAMTRLEADAASLREERDALRRRLDDGVAAAERHDKTVIDEINKECEKAAEALGVRPRRTSYSGGGGGGDNGHGLHSASKAAITSAVVSRLNTFNDVERREYTELKTSVNTDCRFLEKAGQKL